MISKSTIDKILDAAVIDEIIGDYVQLKRRGANLLGLCPFHNEKTPSFTVSPAKNIYKCFGCGKGGDAVNFLMEYEQLSYPEALRNIADRYNIEVEEENMSDDQRQLLSEKESILIALNYANKHFISNLWNNDEGINIGLSYFKERGFLEDTIKQFELGYSLDAFDTLLNKAIDNNYSKEVLSKAGLIKEKNNKHFDFFRGRVMFPIHNVSGKVVAFGGRILANNVKAPKYVNTAETLVYNKSKTLYGMYQAKQDIKRLDQCVLVEGYTDVISFHQASIKNAVASSGTSLTKEQVQLIKRYTNNIIIIYDGDSAGLKAALRGVDIILEQNMNVKVAILPEGEDPDSFVRRAGTQGVQNLIDNEAKDFILFKSSLLANEAANDPVKLSEVIKDIISSIALIDDSIKTTLYLRQCSKLLSIDESVLINEFNKAKRAWIKQKSNKREENKDIVEEELTTYTSERIVHQQKVASNSFGILEQAILKLAISHGQEEYADGKTVVTYIIKSIGAVGFKEPHYQILFEEIKKIHAAGSDDLEKALLRHENNAIKKIVIELLADNHALSDNWFKKFQLVVKKPGFNLNKEVQIVLARYKLERVKELLEECDEEIKSAQNEDRLMELVKIKQRFIEQKRNLSEILGAVVIP